MTPKILVTIDFSDCATHVVRKGIEVARELEASVVLMHSVQTPDGLDDETPVGDGHRRPAISLLLDEAREQLAEHGEVFLAQGLELKQVVTVGGPAEQIVRMAEQEKVSRIVMGTKGRRGRSRLLLGRVAEEASRKAPTPVVRG